ncbi:MAG: hypothetical protein ACXVNF_03760 [Neobacillus sp.]
MFTNFDELKLESEMRVLDKQIDRLIAIKDFLNKILEIVPYKEKYTNDLLNKEYLEVSIKLKVLISVEDNIQKIIDKKEGEMTHNGK